MRLLPDSLIGRTLLFVGVIMLLLILGGALLLNDERRDSFRELNWRHLINQVATAVRTIHDAGADERQRLLKKLAIQGFEFSLDSQPLFFCVPRAPPERRLFRRLRHHLPFVNRGNTGIRLMADRADEDMRPPQRQFKPRVASAPPARGRVVISVRMPDDLWLNMVGKPLGGPPPWAIRTLGMFFFLLLLLGLGGVFVARRMAQPMAALAAAADRIGRGENSAVLLEKGPSEVRQTIRAFNRMQERMQRQLQDRSLMLSAISHDLRTPITTLRLRAEYIDDTEIREKTLATLADMEEILSVSLSFARDEAADEQGRPTDLSSLLQSLCDDHADLGWLTEYVGPERLILECRPTAMRRAIGNLIENAIKYGDKASVTLRQDEDGITILVEDDGPGIPEEQLEQVFTPFYRLEQSRSRETGGIGLGLALARTLIHAQGGDLYLENRASGGLRAVVKFH